ncbi:MAG: hypothetical protein ABIQ31_14015 [Ferruginibacter sp.]
MRNIKKYLLTLLISLVLIVAGVGYYLYNKPARDIKNTDGLEVAATELYATFIKDSTAAKKNYTNKILQVSGKVNLLSENQLHQAVAMLNTNIGGAAINCTLEGSADGLKAGDSIIIKGICNGMGEGDADLGIMGDVYLVRCYILK